MMRITLRCPGCDAALPIDASQAPGGVRCGRCGREMPLHVSDAVRGDRAVDGCPLCVGTDFYVRKDFDPTLGLIVVIIGALISAAFYWAGFDLIAYGILAGAALLDLIIYRRLSDVTVCYRCHAEFRGQYDRTAGPFDLHTADLLEPQWERKIGRR
jgi:hypothetical protein